MTTHLARRHTHRRPRKRSEGMVLLIVLMIITVASATAAYALQGSAVEVQAAGAYKRRMQVRYASESLVMATATLVDEIHLCEESFVGSGAPTMARYGLPNLDPDSTSSPGGFSMVDFVTDNTVTSPLPSECDLRFPACTTCLAGSGTDSTPRSVYYPFFAALKERWARVDTSPGSTGTPYRCAVTVFGELNIDGRPFLATPNIPDGAQDDSGVGRRYHDTISMSQAYYDFSQ